MKMSQSDSGLQPSGIETSHAVDLVLAAMIQGNAVVDHANLSDRANEILMAIQEGYSASDEAPGFLNRAATLAPLMMMQQEITDLDGIRNIMFSIGESFVAIGKLNI